MVWEKEAVQEDYAPFRRSRRRRCLWHVEGGNRSGRERFGLYVFVIARLKHHRGCPATAPREARAGSADRLSRPAGQRSATASAFSDRRSPRSSIRNVIPTMRRSTHKEALRIYQMSSASFSVGDSRVPPFT